MERIEKIAERAGIDLAYVEPYGKYKAKIDTAIFDTLKDKENGKLVLVTAITPTKAGEGKTTTSIALAEGFGKINQQAMLCLREPSLGPVFGIKGGATGGGLASITPAEDINLHFNGDMHALTSSINLISAIVDNSIYQGNPLNIDPSKIVWKRAMDMNDRALRSIYVSNDDKKATPRHDEFVITVASEMMAILCLAKDENDFVERVNRIIVAYTFDDKPIRVKDLKISHAIMKLMKEALKPNLVQTLEGNPALVHGGPFANIAHGCNSIIATKLGLKLAPIVVTEAGFGADLGAEKFMDIKCQEAGLKVNCVVLVATIRALKLHGGQLFENLAEENIEALKLGMPNLKQHIYNVRKYGVPLVIAINRFGTDTDAEINIIKEFCEKEGLEYSLVEAFAKGGEGAIDLAKKVQHTLFNYESHFKPLYTRNEPNIEKLVRICKEIYRCDDVIISEKAMKEIKLYESLGFEDAYICVAKTPLSFSDNPKLLGVPKNFNITVREVRLSAGANFLVALTGDVMTMPGLPKVPAAVLMEEKPW